MLPHQGPYPIYHYMYDHIGTITMAEGIMYPQWQIILKVIACYFGLDLWSMNLGVGHGDELFLMFKPRVEDGFQIDLLLNAKDRKVSAKLLQFWTNFAKYHDPNHPYEAARVQPKWEPTSVSFRQYLNITTEDLKMDSDENFRDRVMLWREIIRRVRAYRNFMSDEMPLLRDEIERARGICARGVRPET